MKKRTYVLIIFLIFFLVLFTTALSLFFLEIGKPPSLKAHSFLELPLSGKIHEKAAPEIWSAILGTKPPLSMYDIWMNMQKAKADSRIHSLVLRLGYLQCDWAKINELREMVLDFRKSGKKTYAYITESMEFDKEYYLATACDTIVLHPLGVLVINGIGGYTPFFKKTLEKLGIEAEFEHVEEYKTAANMLTEEGFTPAHKQMMESLYEDIFQRYIKVLAEARGKSENEIRSFIDHAYFQGEEALEKGLVDALLFEDEFENLVKGKFKESHRVTLERYSKVKPSSLGLNKGKKIALIYGQGPIHIGEGFSQSIGSTTLSRWIRKARLDKSVAAIVLRVDSPGGSAVASDVIWREIMLAKKEKPFVVSMSDLAGSGGYWISMAAHKIVAQPQTYTGSIGVLFGKFNMAQLYEKLGITAEKLTYGKRADLYSTFRKLTQEEREFLKKEIVWVYERFLTKVAESRNMTKEAVDQVARGRVWTGSQAKELGLVDETGGLARAVELTKELAGIPSEEAVKFVVWPKKASFFDLIFGRKQTSFNLNLKLRWEKAFLLLSLLEKDKTWAVMPFWIAAE